MLLCVIKRGWIVFFVGLLSACGSGSTDPEPKDPDPVTPKVVTVTGFSPNEVDLNVEVSFTVLGKSLDNKVTFEMNGCLSPVLSINSETELVFHCTPTVAGTQMATIKDSDGKFLNSYPVAINEKVIEPPAAPAMLKTEAKSGLNQLSWNAQPNVTYTLYSRLISKPSSSWLEVESGLTDISYEDPLTNSHLYEYAVSAVNVDGESPKRTETEVVPRLQIKSVSKIEGDDGITTPFEFEVTLNRAATKTVTASYKSVADSTAEESDYTPVANGQISFATGETRTSISILVTGDSIVENDEYFFVHLSDAVNAVLDGNLAQVMGTILNDDQLPTAPNRPTQLKTEAKTAINLLSWDAQPDVTYTLYNRLISLDLLSWNIVESGLTEPSYEDRITDSHLYEYAVSAISAGGESLKRSETSVVPQLWVNGVSKAEGGEGIVTPFEFQATLNRAATQIVTAHYKTVAGSAFETEDYDPVNNGELSFAIGEVLAPIFISIFGDSMVEEDEKFSIQMIDALNATLNDNALTEATAVILNDDVPPPPEVDGFVPLSVTMNTEVDFTVTGQFLTEQVSLDIESCSSPVLLDGGSENQRIFRCTPSASGQKIANVRSASNEVLNTFSITVVPEFDTLAMGAITEPLADESYEGDIDIVANATDADGLKKVSVHFSSSNSTLILCDQTMNGLCSGSSGSWTKKINPSAYTASSGALTLELWVLDAFDKNIMVDSVTFQWSSTAQNYTAPLNDTGATQFFNALNEVVDEQVDFPGQDASFGRDITRNDNSDGHAGFSFTRLDNMGNELLASANEWSCIRDNVTGLIWESKTDDGGLHDKDERLSWYTSNESISDDYRRNDNVRANCYGYVSGVNGSYCNTEAYTARVNAAGLCGLNQWRLPERRELTSLLNSERIAPAIDVNWFPNTAFEAYWSSQPSAFYSPFAWSVDFNRGIIDGISGKEAKAVRLVHPVQ